MSSCKFIVIYAQRHETDVFEVTIEKHSGNPRYVRDLTDPKCDDRDLEWYIESSMGKEFENLVENKSQREFSGEEIPCGCVYTDTYALFEHKCKLCRKKNKKYVDKLETSLNLLVTKKSIKDITRTIKRLRKKMAELKRKLHTARQTSYASYSRNDEKVNEDESEDDEDEDDSASEENDEEEDEDGDDESDGEYHADYDEEVNY